MGLLRGEHYEFSEKKMTRTVTRDKIVNNLLEKVGLFIFRSYMLIARNLNRLIIVKPKMIFLEFLPQI